MDTLRSFKRWRAKGVFRQMSCQGITRQSTVLFRLLTQTIETPKKRNRDCQSDKHIKKKKWKRTIASKIEKKLLFPYVVPTQHEHRIAVYAHLQYHYA